MPNFNVEVQASGLIVVNSAGVQISQDSLAEALVLAQQAFNLANAAAAIYTHSQGAAATTWTIVHSLNSTSVVVQTYDASLNEIEGVITVIDVNTVEVNFNIAVAGIAIVAG